MINSPVVSFEMHFSIIRLFFKRLVYLGEKEIVEFTARFKDVWLFLAVMEYSLCGSCVRFVILM